VQTRRSGFVPSQDQRPSGLLNSAVVIAASIFLDIFNVFLLWLDLFGGERD
jgi:FtsH-binding integral membrane protein